jgi:endonuclease YncB( thermonuclease family)
MGCLLSKRATVELNCDIKNPQQQLVPDEFRTFDLNNINGLFYVESVYDGDTITILIPIKTHIYNMKDRNNIDINSDTNKNNLIYLNRVRVRLYGIDTPEMKPRKDLPNREQHIIKAKESKQFLSNLILNQVINVNFLQNDKYGRPLVNIFLREQNINELMVSKGFAKKYDGGTKDTDF